MDTAQTIKEFRDTLQSCRDLRRRAREVRDGIIALGGGIAAHKKKHGGENLTRAGASLKRAATAMVGLLDQDIASCEWSIKQIIADDDSLKRTPHVDISRRCIGGFRGRYTATAQQRLNSPWA